MPKIELPIDGGYYLSDSLPISAQECTNWYPRTPESQGLSSGVLFGTPGLNQLATTGGGLEVNRGAHVKGGIPYFVNGNKLYRLDRSVDALGVETFSTVELGGINGSGRVSMADNGTQLMILVPGGTGYIYNEDAGTPFQIITDLDFTANGSPQQVKFLDGYFVVTTDSKRWIISAINDGLSWNALDFGTAESDPDNMVAPVIVRNQLMILGSETTEAFQNSPNGSGFPFIRSNLFLDKGCFAPFSVVNAGGTFAMIGGGVNESPSVWLFGGNGYQRISTIAIDTVLAKATPEELDAAFAVQYSQDGHVFICWTVADRTFCYDLLSGKWHERKSEIVDTVGRWRVNSLVTAYGRLLTGDQQDGRIGELDDSEYQEYGMNIRRSFSTIPFSAVGDALKVPMVELTFESGVGNDLVAEPVTTMAISDDAKNFKYERTRSMGKIGEYSRRAIWYRNGRFPRFRVLRFTMSDPVKPVVIKLEAKYA